MAAVKRQLDHACMEDPSESSCSKRSRRVEIDKAECGGKGEVSESLPAHQHSHDLGHLKSLQRLNPRYDVTLKYVKFRNLLVSFISDVCDEFNLMSITMHRSLNYLDRLLSAGKHAHISRQCYQLVATACILVAAKFEEQPQNVPTIAQLLSVNAGATSADRKQQLISAEKTLLEALEWNAHSATHLHFSHCYINKGVLFPKDTIDDQPVTPKDKRVIVRCIELIAKLSLEEYSFLNYDQSLAAAAGVAAARRFCRVNPVWPDELATICGYQAEEVGECFENIQKMFRENCPEFECANDKYASPKSVTCLYFGGEACGDAASPEPSKQGGRR